MGRRDLLNDEERKALFGLPLTREGLVSRYTLSRSDLDLIQSRRGDTNRLGFALQLALLRYPGFGLQPGDDVNLVAGYGVRMPKLFRSGDRGKLGGRMNW
jgi:TnpA family transposase